MKNHNFPGRKFFHLAGFGAGIMGVNAELVIMEDYGHKFHEEYYEIFIELLNLNLK